MAVCIKWCNVTIYEKKVCLNMQNMGLVVTQLLTDVLPQVISKFVVVNMPLRDWKGLMKRMKKQLIEISNSKVRSESQLPRKVIPSLSCSVRLWEYSDYIFVMAEKKLCRLLSPIPCYPCNKNTNTDVVFLVGIRLHLFSLRIREQGLEFSSVWWSMPDQCIFRWARQSQ